MPVPSKKDVAIGISFVLAGLASELLDQLAVTFKVQGKPTLNAHNFNHMFFVWTLKQILLAFLLLLWKAIDSDWCGMSRFRHAEFDDGERRNPVPNNIQFPLLQEEGDIPVNQGNDREPLVRANPPRAGNQPRPFVRRAKRYTKILFFIPAVCSQLHTILIYFGMRLTYPSSAIMLKGTQPVFVFLLALAFLAQQIAAFMWIGVVAVAIGFAASGLSDYIHITPTGYERYGVAAGDLLFVMGQITLATQMIYEEKFMKKLSIHPMKFLGAEGVYGVVFSAICLIVFTRVDTVQYTQLPNYRVEDVVDAFNQLGNCWLLCLVVFGSVISYVVYMYLGMLIIKEHGAMNRAMISMISADLYWAVSLGIRWQNFFISQVPGLVTVMCGLLIYSHILVFPCSCLRGENMAGEIGPNDFFANDDELDGQNGYAVGGEDDRRDNVQKADGLNGIPDDDRLIEDGAHAPRPEGMDDELLDVVA